MPPHLQRVVDWKGAAKLNRVSPVECHKQSGLNCTECVHRTQVGLPQCLW
jgi:hypothetical protein